MNHLLRLLIDNKGRGQFRAEKKEDEATLYLYDVIVSDDYWGGVSAEKFVKELRSITVPTIHLRINSPGGDVFAARAMEQAIREHSSKIIAHVDGYAASAASVLAIAADEVEMAEGGFYMIHKAWTFAYGNSDDLMEAAGLLEKVDGTLVATYAKRTGKDETTIADWMKAETWFTAQEALDNGFIDRVAEGKVKGQWNLAAYGKAPKTEEPKEEPKEEPNVDLAALRRRLEIKRAA
jgi:ATP-dependent Clp protease, protease subunit